MNKITTRVAVLHDPVSSDAGPDAQDTLAQVQAVSEALRVCGYDPRPTEFLPDLEDLRRKLAACNADAVFNLVESVDGSARLLHLAPAFLEHLNVPYTGAGSAAMQLSTDKLLAKRTLFQAGISTPPWRAWPRGVKTGTKAELQAGEYIVKSVHEHASLGLDAASVVRVARPEELDEILAAKHADQPGVWFAERYIEGREFNVSLMESSQVLDEAPQCDKNPLRVLPPAEILFEGFEPGQPRIVDYCAKWDTASAAYRNTPRRFDLGADAEELSRLLVLQALRVWRAFGLRGYGRVDFRVERKDRQWGAYVIDVNANPCLAPDAGFAAALEAASTPYARGVGDILKCACALLE
jgi:D-alanine-D-alanine ligase